MTLWLILAYAVTAVLAGVDQLIKIWAVDTLRGTPDRPFLPIGDFDWMHLRYTENNGAAFSMLAGSKWFLIGFSAVMIAVCLILMHKLSRNHRWLLCTMPLIAGGGLGNLIDRVFRDGLVVDYLDFQLMDFAIFNFADCCVCVGVLLMTICLLFIEQDEKAAKPLKQAKTLGDAAQIPAAECLSDAEDIENA